MSQQSRGRLALGIGALVVVVQALMLSAFAWPAVNSGPREVPLAVAGPPPAVAGITQALERVPGADKDTPAFAATNVSDAAEAEQAILDREVYGAVAVAPEGVRIMVASGASPAVAQQLRGAATELGSQLPPELAAGPPEVVDLAPGDPDDPNGAALAAGVLPLVMTGGVAGVAIGLLLGGVWVRLAALGGVALAGGSASAAILQYVLGALPGPYLALAGVLSLLIGAVVASVAGLAATLGRAGAATGMLLMLFIGNPLSAAATAPELAPFGAFGQLLPPGAGASLLRSVAFFDGSGAGSALLVLGSWLVVGLALVSLGGVLRRSALVTLPAAESVPAGT